MSLFQKGDWVLSKDGKVSGRVVECYGEERFLLLRLKGENIPDGAVPIFDQADFVLFPESGYWCAPCRQTPGQIHCAHPEECGSMKEVVHA